MQRTEYKCIPGGQRMDIESIRRGEIKDLTGANLTGANLRWANLRWANLYGADLTGANLHGANLTGANLYGAHLHGADLTGADLTGANLRWANLHGADLTGANLTGANLTGAHLTGAHLTGANLTGANLTGANLTGAKLTNAKLPAFQVPQDGAITVYKKLAGGCIARLLVPAKAKRTASLIGRKCRAEYVKVLSITDRDGNKVREGFSGHDNTMYRVGQIVCPDKYDPDIRVECTHGIHFFLTIEEARAY